MRLGILADVHEHLGHLRAALDAFRAEGVDRVVLVGDLFELGRRLDAAVALFDGFQVEGVWGNHDFLVCETPEADLRGQYAPATVDLLKRLRPRLAVDGFHFVHVDPWLDPEKLEDLWYFDDQPWYRQPPVAVGERLGRIFGADDHPVTLIGHYHRWLLATPEGLTDWSGDRPVEFPEGTRFLVIIQAAWEGGCAILDTVARRLHPLDVRGRGGGVGGKA
ncbi:MAG: metallophosphoesterase family protein [Isosphaeraceae bacterium]